MTKTRCIRRYPESYFACFIAICLLLFIATGCGRQSDIDKVVVKGLVTFDGVVLSKGQVRFIPIEGTTGPIAGAPIVDGQYVAKAKGGVPIGRHRVEIKALRTVRNGVPDENGSELEQYIPFKYNQFSELTCTVDNSATTHDFVLER